MSKYFRFLLILLLIVSLSSMGIHKFYMAIYQIDYVPQKKRIQITSRIFVDDLNAAIEKKFHVKTNLGNGQETAQDEVNMKKYLAEKFSLKVNGIVKPMTFLSKEVEANVLICYFRIPDVSKITHLEIENSALTEWNTEQQNIIQANIKGEKQSLMLTSEDFKRVLK
ncbi:DUF6702 family protein [Flavobacterium sp.]|uniref:DUF6702 family protein n=1 Tax=Flavobacterium sp. TaxID=239 RepID=UPI003BC4620B